MSGTRKQMRIPGFGSDWYIASSKLKEQDHGTHGWVQKQHRRNGENVARSPASAVHGTHRAIVGKRRTAAGGERVRVEPRHDSQRDARTPNGHHLLRRIYRPRPMACRGVFAEAAHGHSGHRQGIQSNGPAVSDAAVVHATDRGRTSPTTDRPQGIRGGGTADSANVANEAQ